MLTFSSIRVKEREVTRKWSGGRSQPPPPGQQIHHDAGTGQPSRPLAGDLLLVTQRKRLSSQVPHMQLRRKPCLLNLYPGPDTF